MGRNIVIAAAGKNLGKTLLSESLARDLTSRGLSCTYFKLRRVKGSDLDFISGPGREGSDTFRLMEAGAAEVGILSYGDSVDPCEHLPECSSSVDAAIWETNSAAVCIPDATVVYIHGDVEEPKNPELAAEASVNIDGPLDNVCADTSGLILYMAGLPGFNPVKPAWKLWLEVDSGPIFGRGIARLLEAIRDTGSILAASKLTGIQYRRSWTLVSKTEEKLNVRLINRSRGGTGGGGSSLTPVAEMLLNRFHFLEDSMKAAARELEKG